MIFLVNLDLNGNEIRNVVLNPLSSAPADAKIGQIYYDTELKELRIYKGEAGWYSVGGNIDPDQLKEAIVMALPEILGDEYAKKDELPEVKIITISTGQTSGNASVKEGQKLLSVLAQDSDGDVILVDASISGQTVTVSIAESYEKDITVILTVL